jgi:GTP-binding protein
MKIHESQFVKSAVEPKHFPAEKLPEFAFFGRSNVGKSSLINMLVGKKDLVKTGGRPGVTQMINFFKINESMYFVDLPGFGYANVPRAIQNSFSRMIQLYLESTRHIRIAFLLIDCRRVPGEYEKDIITRLSDHGIPTAVVATKCDKLARAKLHAQLRNIAEELHIEPSDIFITSAEKKTGRKDILNLIGASK